MTQSKVLIHGARPGNNPGETPIAVPIGGLLTVLAPDNSEVLLLASEFYALGLQSAAVDRLYRVGDVDTQGPFPLSPDGEKGLAVVPRPLLWNGATWDRTRSASALHQAAATKAGVALAAPPGEWTAMHAPAAATQATATRAAGGAGVRHVCRSLSFTLATGATATAAPIDIVLRDGLTGVGPVLWAGALSVPINDVRSVLLAGLSIVGSINTAMTIEFAAAGPAASVERVTLTGYSIN